MMASGARPSARRHMRFRRLPSRLPACMNVCAAVPACYATLIRASITVLLDGMAPQFAVVRAKSASAELVLGVRTLSAAPLTLCRLPPWLLSW